MQASEGGPDDLYNVHRFIFFFHLFHSFHLSHHHDTPSGILNGAMGWVERLVHFIVQHHDLHSSVCNFSSFGLLAAFKGAKPVQRSRKVEEQEGKGEGRSASATVPSKSCSNSVQSRAVRGHGDGNVELLALHKALPSKSTSFDLGRCFICDSDEGTGPCSYRS